MLKQQTYTAEKPHFPQPPSGGCVLKHYRAATNQAILHQPPSGGCVLKHNEVRHDLLVADQPPSGGCVLKLLWKPAIRWKVFQPPSGGCVLKRHILSTRKGSDVPAAFGRLCVETFKSVV